MNVDLAQAYATACRQLGEAHVQIEFMARELQAKDAEIAKLKEQIAQEPQA